MNLLFEKSLVLDSEVEWDQIEPKIHRKIMSYSADIMLMKVAFEESGVETLHHHPHLQISYMAGGAFEITNYE